MTGFFFLSSGEPTDFCLHSRFPIWSVTGDMRYPVDVFSDGRGFFVVCRDVPEATGHDDDRCSAFEACKASLICVFDDYFTSREAIPLPGDPGQDFIIVPSSVTSKVLLLNEVVNQHVSNSELAKRMGLKRQEITRLFDLNHATKIDTIQKALECLGKRLELRAL